MSKQSPSTRGAAGGTKEPAATHRELTQPWWGRVFHNTYTRRGRRIVLRGWSVKIQNQGQRRTFSLLAPTRAAAAAEAQALTEAIATEGWETVVQQYSRRHPHTFPKTDPGHWKARLLLRKDPFPEYDRRPCEYSTSIHHAGISSYFPLRTSEAEAAAAKALAIYRTVIEQGWEAARQVFAREVTLAFHWGHDPLLWTYTTMHTLVGASASLPRRRPRGPASARRILLVEADPSLRHALQRRIDQHEDCSCAACADGNMATRRGAQEETSLCLVNRDLAERMGLPNPARLGVLANGLSALCYSVHLDSEELFARTPGGMSGYVLKRVLPAHILEPALGVLERGRTSMDILQRTAQAYFQRVVQNAPAREVPSAVAQLTRREQDVLDLLSKGYVDKEIAPALGISSWTVHEHLKRIFDKLQVRSRTEAVLAYLQK